MTVNILMATYNGERYITEQIESIQAQTITDWTLYIRDDGSTDATRQKIVALAEKDERIVFINPDSVENIGVIASFYRLVKHRQADYYFFSDQDDVWLPNKLELCLDKAKDYPAEVPLLVYTDLKVVDQKLQVINDSMIRSQSHHANTTLLQELTENTVTGGTMMINHALAERWTVTDKLLMHDWYLALLAAAFGHLVYIDQPTELYRQHENNVLGARTLDKRFKLLRLGPKAIFTRYWKLIHDSQEQASHLLTFQDLKLEDRQLIEAFKDIDQQPFRIRLKRLWGKRYAKNQWKHTLVFRLLLMTNLYNERVK